MGRITVILTVSACLSLTACGGRSGNPVSQYQPGDEARSCNGLVGEIVSNEAEIKRLMPDADATGKNVALGVAGAFFLVPWFFMDFKEGEQIEIDALRRRNAWLREVATEKGCEVPPPGVQFDDEVMTAEALVQSCAAALGPVPQLGATPTTEAAIAPAVSAATSAEPAANTTVAPAAAVIDPAEYYGKVNSWFDSCDAQVKGKWEKLIKARGGATCGQASQANKPACKMAMEKYGKLRDEELELLERRRAKMLSAG